MSRRWRRLCGRIGLPGRRLDVYEKEPLPEDSPLRDPAIEDRCRLMPHFAQRGADYAAVSRSGQGHGGAMRAGTD